MFTVMRSLKLHIPLSRYAYGEEKILNDTPLGIVVLACLMVSRCQRDLFCFKTKMR